MQHVYCLEAKVHGHRIYKIGKTTRQARQRLAEINESWAKRRIKWRLIHVMSVFDCHSHETRLHREFADCRYKSSQIQSWLGGKCDGDSEIFALDRHQKRALIRAMDSRGWWLSPGTWITLGVGLGLIAIAAMIDHGRRGESNQHQHATYFINKE
jgi:N12 class adenine-specific DNA methylase